MVLRKYQHALWNISLRSRHHHPLRSQKRLKNFDFPEPVPLKGLNRIVSTPVRLFLSLRSTLSRYFSEESLYFAFAESSFLISAIVPSSDRLLPPRSRRNLISNLINHPTANISSPNMAYIKYKSGIILSLNFTLFINIAQSSASGKSIKSIKL